MNQADMQKMAEMLADEMAKRADKPEPKPGFFKRQVENIRNFSPSKTIDSVKNVVVDAPKNIATGTVKGVDGTLDLLRRNKYTKTVGLAALSVAALAVTEFTAPSIDTGKATKEEISAYNKNEEKLSNGMGNFRAAVYSHFGRDPLAPFSDDKTAESSKRIAAINKMLKDVPAYPDLNTMTSEHSLNREIRLKIIEELNKSPMEVSQFDRARRGLTNFNETFHRKEAYDLNNIYPYSLVSKNFDLKSKVPDNILSGTARQPLTAMINDVGQTVDGVLSIPGKLMGNDTLGNIELTQTLISPVTSVVNGVETKRNNDSVSVANVSKILDTVDGWLIRSSAKILNEGGAMLNYYGNNISQEDTFKNQYFSGKELEEKSKKSFESNKQKNATLGIKDGLLPYGYNVLSGKEFKQHHLVQMKTKEELLLEVQNQKPTEHQIIETNRIENASKFLKDVQEVHSAAKAELNEAITSNDRERIYQAKKDLEAASTLLKEVKNESSYMKSGVVYHFEGDFEDMDISYDTRNHMEKNGKMEHNTNKNLSESERTIANLNAQSDKNDPFAQMMMKMNEKARNDLNQKRNNRHGSNSNQKTQEDTALKSQLSSGIHNVVTGANAMSKKDSVSKEEVIGAQKEAQTGLKSMADRIRELNDKKEVMDGKKPGSSPKPY